ncbi:MAG: LacI family DNA-binding transcriptional regulator [Paracoccaceae bacterium]|nr:LacI family DNA-binding transcriptional regulator [Paracoccaceae bacterium]
MTTIRNIAKLAGVSVPTVSRVLNDQRVDPVMTLKVRQAAQSLDYVPNRSAKRLRGVGNPLLGAIFSDLSNQFFTEILKHFEWGVSVQKHSLLMSNSDSKPEKEEELIQVMLEEGVSGLVMAPTLEYSTKIQELIENDFPIVIVDRRMREMEVDTVTINNFEASAKAVCHLGNLGHSEVGYIGGPIHLSSANDRYLGFKEGVMKAGMYCDENWILFGDYKMESGYCLTEKLLSCKDLPSAILVANNEMVVGSLNKIHEEGLRIPHDISIISFDDFPWSISLNPPLTAIAQPTQEIGAKAASLLMDRLVDNTKPPQTLILESNLVVRESCGQGLVKINQKTKRRKI